MARKLALVFLLMQSIQILALPTYENPIASNSLASTNTPHTKRYYFPETLPDQDELEAMLKETSMREAGFTPSSNPSKPNPETKMHKMEPELQQSLPDPDTAIGTDASDRYHNTKLRQSGSKSKAQSSLKDSVVAALESDDHTVYWPPLRFFVIAAAFVCFFTVTSPKEKPGFMLGLCDFPHIQPWDLCPFSTRTSGGFDYCGPDPFESTP
ncbi:unnamed protein product [Penicillium glandicola]